MDPGCFLRPVLPDTEDLDWKLIGDGRGGSAGPDDWIGNSDNLGGRWLNFLKTD